MRTPLGRIVLGVTGGIAAYKACSLLRLLAEAGADVRVVPTAESLNFVGAATWEALSGHPVATGVWTDVPGVPHVRLGQSADVFVIAPATANTVARLAHGMADDLLTNTYLTARCPVIVAPAMHTEMWQHPATTANVAALRERGVWVVDPASGRLTGKDCGPGRLPEPEQLAPVVLAALGATGDRRGDLAGRRVVISAGGTREALDPVRFLTNASSGKQGYALAAAAAARGADVTLVTAAELLPPAGVDVVRVQTATDLMTAMRSAAPTADLVIMAAAVSDFRAAAASGTKVKKTPGVERMTLDLVVNPDILTTLVAERVPGQCIVGFAAETPASPTAAREVARTKLAAKGCDLLVFNDVSGGAVFGADETNIVVYEATGSEHPLAGASKLDAAHHVLDRARAVMAAR